MVIDDVFNAVAPIFIYHKADLCYKKEARAGLKWLKANKEQVKIFFDTNDLNPRSIDKLSVDVFWEAYNTLFKKIVSQETDAEPEVDRWGAYGYRLPTSSFFGDDYGCFPFYMDAESLRQRVREG